MSYPVNWYFKSDAGAASLKRGGSSDQSSYRDVWIVKMDAGQSTLETHQHFSEVLDGSGGTIEGKYGPYIFNYDGYSAKHLGNGIWEVEAEYVTSGGGTQESQQQQGGGGEVPVGVVRNITYNSTGGTQKITCGISEQRAGPNAIDMKMAIGVNGDNVEGVDIVVPVFEWTEEYEVPGTNIAASYFKKCAALTGTINQLMFRGYAVGDVLFLGLTGGSTFNPNQTLGSEVASTKLSFRFAAKENEEIKVGNLSITPTNGWDYIWIKYDDDVANGVGLKKPVAIYANQVYKYGDFRDLQLP